MTFVTWFPFDPTTNPYKDSSPLIGEKGQSVQGKPSEAIITRWFANE